MLSFNDVILGTILKEIKLLDQFNLITIIMYIFLFTIVTLT